MQFNINEWRKIYDKVQFLGAIIKDSNESMDEKLGFLPPLYPISKESKNSIDSEIKELINTNIIYLDLCGLKPKNPLWEYDKENETTWQSSDKFCYKHLVRLGKYKYKNGFLLWRR